MNTEKNKQKLNEYLIYSKDVESLEKLDITVKFKYIEILLKFKEIDQVLAITNVSDDNDFKRGVIDVISRNGIDIELFNKLLNLALSIKDEEVRDKALLSLIKQSNNLMSYEGKNTLIDRILDSKIKNTAICSIFINLEDVELLKKALNIALGTFNIEYKDNMLTSIAFAYSKIKLFDKVIYTSEFISGPSKYSTQLDLVSNLANSGEFEYAKILMQKIKDSGYADMKIAIAYAKSGVYEKAFEIAQDLDNEKKNEILDEVIIFKVESGNFDEALELLKVVEKGRWTNYAVANIVKGYAKIGDFEKAYEIIETSRAVSKEDLYIDIVKILLNSNYRDLDKIHKFILQLNNKVKFSLLYNITLNYAKIGDFEKAYEIIETLDQNSSYLGQKAKTIVAACYANQNRLPLESFVKYVEPVLKTVSGHSNQLMLINLYLSNLDPKFLEKDNVTKEVSKAIVSQKNNQAEVESKSSDAPKHEDQSKNLKFDLKNASRENFYLLSESVLSKIKDILKIKSALKNLDAFRGELNTKIIKGDLEESSRLLYIIITKDTLNSFRYLEKFLFGLENRIKTQKENSTKNINDYLKLFIRLGVKYKLLSESWIKIVSNPKKLSFILKIFSEINKNPKQKLQSLDSLIESLDKLNLLDTDIENISLISAAIENNIISSTLYKILRLAGEENRKKVLLLIRKEQDKIFTSKQPDLNNIIQCLSDLGIQTRELDQVTNQEWLIELIVTVFNLSNFKHTKTLIQRLEKSKYITDKHLIKYFEKGLPDSTASISNQTKILKRDKSLDQVLSNRINKLFRSDQNQSGKPNTLEIEKLLNFNKLSSDFINFISQDENIKNATDKIKDLLARSINDENIYYNCISQIQEFGSILIKDNLPKILAQNFPKIDKDQTQLIMNRVSTYFQNEFIKPIKSEKRKFDTVNYGEEKTVVEFSVSKNIISFFAKAGVALCTAQDVDTWIEFENYFHINIIEDKKLVANIQAYIEKVDGKEVLILRGFNPTSEFLQKVSVENFLKKVWEYATELSVKWLGNSQIYITESKSEWHADSNRSDVSESLKELIYKTQSPIDHKMNITKNEMITKIYPITIPKI